MTQETKDYRDEDGGKEVKIDMPVVVQHHVPMGPEAEKHRDDVGVNRVKIGTKSCLEDLRGQVCCWTHR